MQYNLEKQTAKISVLSSGNIGTYGFLIRKRSFTERGLFEKVATTERFGYSPLGSDLKKQADIGKKQYQILVKVSDLDKKCDKQK